MKKIPPNGRNKKTFLSHRSPDENERHIDFQPARFQRRKTIYFRKSFIRTELEWIRRGARARTTKQKARLERFDEINSIQAPKEAQKIDFKGASTRLGGKTIIADNITKSYNGIDYVPNFSYIINKNDRLGIVGDNGEVETASFSCGNIGSEDIVFDTVNEIEDTLSARRAMVYDLLRLGLFADENGRLPATTKAKLFEILGFGNWESGNDYQENHMKKAQRENLDLEKKAVTPDVYDDHDIHIAEHVKLFVSSKCDKNKNLKERVSEHIAKHKELAGLDFGVQELTRKFEGETNVESEEI